MSASIVLNPTWIDNNCDGSGVMPYTICSWTGGTNGAWQPLGTGVSVLGSYSIPPFTENHITQFGVFHDYGSGIPHRLRVDMSFCLNCHVDVYFGTALVGVLSGATGTTYVTGTPTFQNTLSFIIITGVTVLTYNQIEDVYLTTTPQAVMPVYNPIYFNADSIRKTNTNYKYVFDLYTGTTINGTYQSRIKLLPRPVDGTALYNPSRILESRLSYDKPIQNITACTASVHHLTTYNVQLGEEYGSILTGSTIYTGLTSFSGYTFNGVQQYTQFPSWNYRDYFCTTGSTPYNFLTYQPRSGVKVKTASDRGTVTVHSPNLSSFYNLVVHHITGGTTTYNKAIRLAGIVHLPSGPYNINQYISANTINTDCTSPTGTEYYTIQVITQSVPDTELLRYDIDCRSTCKYGAVRLQFLNRLGGFDYMNFDLVSRKTVNVERKTYKKTLPYNYVVGDREKTVLDINGNYVTKVTSNWCNDDEAEWMEDLLASPEVYIIQDDGVALPVLVQETSIEIQKEVNKKMFNYTFNLETSYGINGQRA